MYMKISLVVLGLILLFAGIIIASSSNISNQKYKIEWTDVVRKENCYNISATFNEGEIIKVEVYPSSDWADYLFPAEDWSGGIPYPNRPVWVNITDPFGARTEFFCDYVKPTDTPTLYLYNVTITENNGLLVGADASLESEMKARPRVMGKTASTGEYIAKVFGVQSPATALIFQTGEKLEWIEYPYSNFVYWGIALILPSAALLFFGLKKPKKKVHVHARKKGKKLQKL